MPPVRHGQVWIRVSRACASSGLLWRFASFARAAARGGSALGLTLGFSVVLATRALRGGSLGQTEASRSASVLSAASSERASIRTGPNRASGPIRFGESRALERSSLRYSAGRYSAAVAAPANARSPVQTAATKAFFRTI